MEEGSAFPVTVGSGSGRCSGCCLTGGTGDSVTDVITRSKPAIVESFSGWDGPAEGILWNNGWKGHNSCS